MLYRQAGVDIDALNAVKRRIGHAVRSTFPRHGASRFGLFGGVFAHRGELLISSTDSVGTKVLVACAVGRHDTVGEDLVNHCVNDILTTGAEPLFFLDYIGFSQLPARVIADVVDGVARACRREGVVLAGGETAQLKGFYPPGIYDLAGFIVGRVRRRDYINPERIRAGDLLFGFASSGLHTNGYSLARKVLKGRHGLASRLPGSKRTVGDALLAVHRSYRPILLPLRARLKGLAHITGGGFADNIERILPRNLDAVIWKKRWDVPAIFRLIQEAGKVPESEMYRVFNMGIGMVAVVRAADQLRFRRAGGRLIGEIITGSGKVSLV